MDFVYEGEIDKQEGIILGGHGRNQGKERTSGHGLSPNTNSE